MDSFYEYLLKAYIVLGKYRYWEIFESTYNAAITYLKQGPWYVEVNMFSGRTTISEFQSLQAFWPGLQVLAGDLEMAKYTYSAFETVWKKYSMLPERYLFNSNTVHPTEKYNPLRPEFAESTFFLFWVTQDPHYLQIGREIIKSLQQHTRVTKGFANIKDILTFELEDRMSSFFLAETCKYLYLLFDYPNNFLFKGNYIFNTEGHIFPVLPMTEEDEMDWNTMDANFQMCPIGGKEKEFFEIVSH